MPSAALPVQPPAPSPAPSPSRDPRLDRRALLLFAAVTLFHVAYAGWLALSPQEAYYWEWSRRLDLSYFDHPPLAAWTIRLFTTAFGDSERAIRLAAAFHSTLFSAFLWLTTRRLFGSRAALLAIAGGAVVPLFSIGQVIVTPDGPLLSGWAMALYCTVRALDDERPEWLLAAGAATGWAMLGKYTGFLLLPQILVLLLWDPRGRRLLRTPWPWLGVVLAAALFSPVVVWNAARHLESFAFQTTGRAETSRFRPVLFGRYVGLQVLAMSPVVLLLCVDAVIAAWRRRAAPAWRVVLIFSAPLLVLATVVSPVHWVKMNWLAPVWPTALAGAAALVPERRGPRWWLVAGGGALALAMSVLLHLWPVVTWLPLPAKDETSAGWRELAARVEAERARLPAGAPVIGCNYKVASELAFYLPGRPETSGVGALGEPGLQYDEWLDWTRLGGRTALVVLDARDGACARREELCRPLEPLEPLTVTKGSKRVTTFSFWRCGLPAEQPRAAGPARP
ncbi:glycosyltransferase family 39 protein [Anaeromyxobacter oryzae]|uniref:Glycosyl transferase n=1 Tax=Anaeromyxobacter oryzae TaxID=2918170 RepID=A0ABN6MLD6_9BACT|nr:glycosyltransferase family 39 protein [Anaeromyxobacter oryzae]BDG01834.1 glycosyl transferase [Anaeromyxobacter oryzae]